MSLRSLTTALTLYRNGTYSLEQAADRGGVSTAKFVSALRSRGIPLREGDRTLPDGARSAR